MMAVNLDSLKHTEARDRAYERGWCAGIFVLDLPGAIARRQFSSTHGRGKGTLKSLHLVRFSEIR